MKFFKKIALRFIKDYVIVAILLALIILIVLQVEKQFRDARYMGNCINDQGWKKYGTVIEKPYNIEELSFITDICQIRKTNKPEVFNYFKGRLFKYSVK